MSRSIFTFIEWLNARPHAFHGTVGAGLWEREANQGECEKNQGIYGRFGGVLILCELLNGPE